MDLRGKRVLVFGDSLTHRGSDAGPIAYDVTEGSNRNSTPGDLLASHLLEQGAAHVRINGKVSRSARNLFTVEDGHAVLASEAAYQPDVVYVFLGTNDLGLDPTKDAEAFTVIRNAFSMADVWAIGPPFFVRTDRTSEAAVVYRTLASVFGADHVIDFRPWSVDVSRTSDGVHFPASSARVVAARLASVIADIGHVATVVSLWKPIALATAGIASIVGALLFKRRRR